MESEAYTSILRISHPEDLKKIICGRKLVLLVLSSPYCPYCEAYRYILASFAEKIGRSRYRDEIAIVEVDVMEHPEIAEELGVYATPTTVIYHKCKVRDGFVGLVDEDTLSEIVSTYLA